MTNDNQMASPQNQIALNGQSAVVTGGANGLGLAIATRLVQSGASVCLWDISEEALDDASEGLAKHCDAGQRIASVIADVSDAGSVADAVQATDDQIGLTSILVNNAGISGPNVSSWDYPVEDWLRVLEINLTGTFLVSRAFLPGMRDRDYGRIVNVASIAGKEGNPNASAYSSSKAGVIGLTKTLGKELADTGVTVNCVTPAAVRTAIFDQMSQEHVEFMLSKIPMGRFGDPEEIAALVAWVTSPECSFSTGAVFDLSGGRATY